MRESCGALRQWLIKRALLDPHQPAGLRGSVWSAGFSDDLCAEADRLIEHSLELCDGDGQRLDLTGHSVYTVDDADTREIDDGLSLEDANDGVWIWIHIADPARLIAPGSPLDVEARRRATSLYLADGTTDAADGARCGCAQPGQVTDALPSVLLFASMMTAPSRTSAWNAPGSSLATD